MNDLLHVLILSLTPGIEARYAILYGVYKKIDIKYLLITCISAIIILAIFLSLLIKTLDHIILKLSNKFKFLYIIYNKYLISLRKKFQLYEKYGLIGLILFIALPLPISGMYTGAFLSYLLGINRIKTFFSLFLGGLSSLIIVTVPIVII